MFPTLHPFIMFTPAQMALVSENLLIAFMLIINLTVLVLLSLAVKTSDFLVLPLAIEWFALVLVALYLLVREGSPRGTPPSLSAAAVMFSSEFFLGLGKVYKLSLAIPSHNRKVTSLALTIRAWEGSTLCDDFGKLPKSCSVALAIVAMAWLGTTTALAGILLSCAPPLYRMHQALCTRRRKVNSKEHVIELADIPSHYQPSYGGKEEWTDIPV
ncbi:hypothetical protein C8R46DRAFT_1216516 [Mycena filopes]|nr:hypothetical protein C8R46DRAFT_1216516 [Mycena filopes]